MLTEGTKLGPYGILAPSPRRLKVRVVLDWAEDLKRLVPAAKRP